MLLRCCYYMCRSQDKCGQMGCKHNSNQQKIVKARVGVVVKHFKLESTYLEKIHRRLSVLKIKYEVQLKILDCQKNLILRFFHISVFKPKITVLKLPSWGDLVSSKFLSLRNGKSNLFWFSVVDNTSPCALYLYVSREQHIEELCWVFLEFLDIFYIVLSLFQ